MKPLAPFVKILTAFCGFITLLLAVRIFYTGTTHYLFLVWNIFLASIPFFISGLFENNYNRNRWKLLLLFFCWLAFFPNALYIITDLIHLQIQTNVPKWFDAVLLFSSSVVGLLLAFISLYRVEKMLQKLMSRKFLSVAIVFILFLGSFGVYLGRFLRWNSWDIVSNPFQLFVSIGHRIIYPFNYLQTWGVTLIFTLFFYLLYYTIKKLPGYLSRANI